MKLSICIIVSVCIGFIANAQVLVFAKANRRQQPMNIELMTFIAETLHNAKPALNLNCEVRMREIKQERKFSDGIKIIEMLEIIYQSKYFGAPEQKLYFPIGSSLIREVKNSQFSGVVEEFQILSEDLVNSRFTFQHNGRGVIVWMSLEDDLKTLPCGLKN